MPQSVVQNRPDQNQDHSNHPMAIEWATYDTLSPAGVPSLKSMKRILIIEDDRDIVNCSL